MYLPALSYVTLYISNNSSKSITTNKVLFSSWASMHVSMFAQCFIYDCLSDLFVYLFVCLFICRIRQKCKLKRVSLSFFLRKRSEKDLHTYIHTYIHTWCRLAVHFSPYSYCMGGRVDGWMDEWTLCVLYSVRTVCIGCMYCTCTYIHTHFVHTYWSIIEQTATTTRSYVCRYILCIMYV